MKANKFRSVIIAVKSALVTLWASIISLYRARRGIYNRGKTDGTLRWWSRKILEFSNLTYTTHNPHGVRYEPDRAHMIMVNHSSMLDIPFTFAAMPGSIRMLAKKELFQVPLWGKGMEEGEFLSIDRQSRKQAFRDLEEARKKMESGIVLWVAPEGTRSRTGKLQPFKRGGFLLAIQTNAVIIPAGIRRAFEALPPGTLDFHTGGRLEFHVGKPVDASQYNRKQIDKLMEVVRNQILELADIEEENCSISGRSPGEVPVP